MKHVCVALALVLCFVGTAYAVPAPPTGAADTPYQVRFAPAQGSARVVNDGAQGDTQLCANFYSFRPDGQMLACCTCSVGANALLTLPFPNNLIPAGIQPPSTLVVKLVGSNAVSGVCTGPRAPGNPVSGLIGWISTQTVDYSLVPATLSQGEYDKLRSQCTDLRTPDFCRSCPQNPL